MQIKKIEISFPNITIHQKMTPKYDEDDFGEASGPSTADDFHRPQLVELE
jgi:hypothetical protein